MKLNAYSVYDSKAVAFLTPFFMSNDAVAVRSFISAFHDPSHSFARNPEDYTLFRVGAFDDSKGEFVEDERISVMTGSEVIKYLKKVDEKDNADYSSINCDGVEGGNPSCELTDQRK